MGRSRRTLWRVRLFVLGKVRGNCQASDRVDIRSEGSLTGDVIAARISIEDGAFFKGGIDIRQARRHRPEGWYRNTCFLF